MGTSEEKTLSLTFPVRTRLFAFEVAREAARAEVVSAPHSVTRGPTGSPSHSPQRAGGTSSAAEMLEFLVLELIVIRFSLFKSSKFNYYNQYCYTSFISFRINYEEHKKVEN